MKKIFMQIGLIIFCTVIMAPCSIGAEDDDNSDFTAEEDQQKLVKVCTLNTVEANQEFNRNVQIIQAQRQQVIQLQNQLESNKDDEDLQNELKAAMGKLQENNKKMFEAYGFSLNRNYVLVTEKAHVYMAVTEEELARIQENSD